MSGATGHFIAQRVSAVVLLFLGLWFAACMLCLQGFEYELVRAFVAAPLNGGLLVLLSLTAAYHSYLGVEVVIDDYVHAPGLNSAAQLAARFAHLLLALVSVYAIYRIGFGA